MTTSINLYDNKNYNACQFHANEWKERVGGHYKELLCLHETTGPQERGVLSAFKVAKPFIKNSVIELLEHYTKRLCCLPKGHKGKCDPKPHTKFFTNKQMQQKVDSAVLQTPGNDDYVFKNRSSRLFPIFFTDEQERSIKDKKKPKKKCAIPLKDSTTPFMMATAYMDYITMIFSLRGVERIMNKKWGYMEVL